MHLIKYHTLKLYIIDNSLVGGTVTNRVGYLRCLVVAQSAYNSSYPEMGLTATFLITYLCVKKMCVCVCVSVRVTIKIYSISPSQNGRVD